MSSCVSNVTFNTDVPGADIYVDGQLIGQTPVVKEMSNAVWENPDILIKKEGYKDMHVALTKEVKLAGLLCGIFLFWPVALWSYGPKEQQHWILIPERQ